MDYILIGVILGIVQGISEWIPISSKTQVLIVSLSLLGLSFSVAYSFGLFMEIGTIAAAIIYFRREISGLLKALVRMSSRREDYLLLKFLVIVTIITGLMGVPLYLFVISLPILGLPMTVLGVVLLIDGIIIYLSRKNYIPRKGLHDLRLRDIIIVGIAQGLAALPGVSRSGITTSALILLGVKPEEAFKLSFISLIPAALGAIGVTVLFSKHEVSQAVHSVSLSGLLISIVVATFVSIFFINALLRFARTNKVVVLVIILGIIAIISGILSGIAKGFY
ncbi:undecaprenyl-diphosphate phosphatase [Saccharolobus islandicus]|uniref:Undecaprenyl-diphosphatase n=1 Tax=Saccharolobus islandicus (strain M.16.4 / Kamchatka \|nr:undecaprenyl-diphosphate phosphatase [Sulfolobus islandicus]C4KFQ2.1 RecName: Full=Undecaprenyl-diphosphatase; AltName: Full=Undecaprenyl pyrophosphate phosphatase [Sulfolobus islandicus M.16.4]ACR41416.1 Bacitracin resistance protein BacA [Sulfolobus islandicus M.16.4]